MIKEIVSNYRSVINSIGELIDVSGYKHDYIAKKIYITPATFSIKKGRQSFSLNEIEKIVNVIENEDVINLITTKLSEKRMNNISRKTEKNNVEPKIRKMQMVKNQINLDEENQVLDDWIFWQNKSPLERIKATTMLVFQNLPKNARINKNIIIKKNNLL